MAPEVISQMKPFIVMEVLEKAAKMEQQGIHVVHMEVGEPDFPIPSSVAFALNEAVKSGHTHYTHSLGDIELRQEIAQMYKREYGVEADPECILVTSGSSPAILLTLSVLCQSNDEVIISDPGYACYANFIRFVGARPVLIKVSEEDGFEYSPELIKELITERTRAIIINSPMNPTGNMLKAETMKEICSLGIPVISDEIYHGLVYEGKAHTALEFTEKTFVVNGFSKRYAMTGLRLGYVIVPQEFIRPMQILQQNFFICASSMAQRAGVVALKEAHPELEQMRQVYDTRRKYLLERLKQIGFDIKVEPTGAFYVFVNCKHLSRDSYQLAFDILEKAHVGVTPGIDFGQNGEGFIRFSYANSLENIEEGMNRLEQYLNRYF